MRWTNQTQTIVPAKLRPNRARLCRVVNSSEMLRRSQAAFCSRDLASSAAHAQTTGSAAPALQSKKFTDWGWPQPYEQISAKSKQWLQSKGWWPLNAAWIVVWSGQEMIGHVLQTLKLLERRGIETEWRTFVAAGFSNEAFIPGRIQIANTGALGVLALLTNKVPTRALAVHSPALTHAATVPLDSPLKSLADLKGGQSAQSGQPSSAQPPARPITSASSPPLSTWA